ncbi:MAG: aminoacyl-histidine dipeptidase, partial [Bacteroidales bacterium]|nr:aminoacyl-histidine dipeptidase [Bacteroidales bacterium]
MKTIQDLTPKGVWKNFYLLTQIPRPSYLSGPITKFLLDFGKNLGLEAFTDDVGNVIIRKPASSGMEDRKGVIIQGHMDMVPQKNNDTEHNFETDPIQTYIDEDWVKARGTTLGADNGLGVAAMMSILEDDTLKHGPLEMLITKDEEVGMIGAFGLKPDVLQGEILLNLDSEDEGDLYIGCAGGTDVIATLEYKETVLEENDEAYMITLKG